MSETEKDAAARDFLQTRYYHDQPEAHKGSLSPAEIEAVHCISHGLTTAMAAEVLGKSEHTVGNQIKSAKAALNAKTRAHLVAICYRQRLID